MAHVPRLYRPGHIAAGPLVLDGEQAKRLAGVMRLRSGDEFRLFSGDGREWRAAVSAVSRSYLQAVVSDVARQEPPPLLVVEAWIGLVRPNRFDWAVEKCVEAGVDIIRPLVSDHAARGEGSSTARADRWERIAIEAAEQCGRLHLAVIEPPARFEELIARHRGGLFVGDREGRPWPEAAVLVPPQGRVAIAIGPEGGFSAEELTRARARGGVAVSFGPNVLRTETAAVVAVGLIRAGRV